MGANTFNYPKSCPNASRIKINLSIISVCIIVLGFYFIRNFGFNLASIVSTLVIGSVIGFFITLFENHSLDFKPVRRRCAFCNHIAIKTANFSVVLVLLLSVATIILAGIDVLFSLNIFPKGISDFFLYQFWQILIICLGLSFSINLWLEINRKLGPGALFKLVSGKYHQPQEEERVFLFIDLNNSTEMAEKLGNLRFSQLLQDFFFDISEPVSRFGGEIYQYVGDEVVITWNFKKGVDNNNSVNCFLAIKKTIESLSAYYNKMYGFTPTFKGGLHCGKVVLAEIGKMKTEIAYHGDVINTTSRITDFCKIIKRDFLISENLTGYLKAEDHYRFVPLGSFNLRGKSSSIDLYFIEDKNITEDVGTKTFELSLN
jgi:adenylate cyclase